MQRYCKSSSNTILEYITKPEVMHSVKDEKEKVVIKDLKLKLQKKVTWTEDTVDNEHMNKKKSKSKNMDLFDINTLNFN
jgi:hypothetical protein